MHIDALMIQQSGASLAQVLDWGLFDAKVLRKPTMSSCQLGPQEQTWIKFK